MAAEIIIEYLIEAKHEAIVLTASPQHIYLLHGANDDDALVLHDVPQHASVYIFWLHGHPITRKRSFFHLFG